MSNNRTETISAEAFRNMAKVVKGKRIITTDSILKKALANSDRPPAFIDKPVVLGQKILINRKPMSVNGAWKGQRFKTDEYKQYESDMLFILPKIDIPPAPYKISYEFGLSNKANDIDNGIKALQDILQKKYGFNDKDIYELNARKIITKKGDEFFSFKIETLITP